ncbi:flagellar FlbD family protein [Jatrophihabitans fulvus]
MLQLTRLSGPTFALNPDLIERAEATPDTVVTLVNGSKYVIRESLDELVTLVRRYRADIVNASRELTPPTRPTRSRTAAQLVTNAVNAGTTNHGDATVVPLRDESGDA